VETLQDFSQYSGGAAAAAAFIIGGIM